MLQKYRYVLQKLPAAVKQRIAFAYTTTATEKCTQKPTTVIESDGVREIILNEPKTRNSLSMAMMDSILTDLTTNKNDKELRCIILSAKGKIWSAGHNLKELASDGGCELQRAVFNKLTEIIMNINKMPVPVIAKVNGLAAAAGCQLVASCDIAVCTDKSTFSTPGVNFGIFCSTPGIALARVMPRMKSSYMVMTGLPIDAQAAYIAGLVTTVVPEADLDCEIKRITDSINAKSRAVIALGKEFYYRQINLGMEKAYELGAEKMTENLNMADGKEGLKSFIEKRKPKWTSN